MGAHDTVIVCMTLLVCGDNVIVLCEVLGHRTV